jgi:hypothetical protein
MACEHLGSEKLAKKRTGKLRGLLTKTGGNHGVGDAGQSDVGQTVVVLAENGASSARLIDTLLSVGAGPVQHPVEFGITVLGDLNSLVPHLSEGQDAEEWEPITPVSVDVTDPVAIQN